MTDLDRRPETAATTARAGVAVAMRDLQRRFGAVGLIFNSVMFSPIVGLLVAIFASLQLGHRRTTRVLAIVAFVIAVEAIWTSPSW